MYHTLYILFLVVGMILFDVVIFFLQKLYCICISDYKNSITSFSFRQIFFFIKKEKFNVCNLGSLLHTAAGEVLHLFDQNDSF